MAHEYCRPAVASVQWGVKRIHGYIIVPGSVNDAPANDARA